jgi:predicted aldo/keto reductase-like oxidoreductase
LWDQPEVSVVLSGMSTMAQVKENLASACTSGAGSFTEEDHALVARLRERYASLHPIPCTRCGYCMPCPEGVDIPLNFQLYNDASVHGGNNRQLNRNLYVQLTGNKPASACTACGTCEEKCPQSIPVRDWMPKVHDAFAES